MICPLEILEGLRIFKLSIFFDPVMSLIEIYLEEKNHKCKDCLQRMYIAEFIEVGNKWLNCDFFNVIRRKDSFCNKK